MTKKQKNKSRHDEIRACLEELKQTEAGQDILGFMDQMESSSLDLEDIIAQYLQEKPFKTVGMALLAGIIIGYILHSK